nr:flavohemoprotein [Sulfolobus islandicus]
MRAGVKPEQYPLVGELSLDAIKEILNPPEEVLKAWEKTYNYLTKILREKEQK